MAWMQDQPDEQLFISVMSLAELRRGILQLPVGAKRSKLEAWFASEEGPEALFFGRVLPFDIHAARMWAELMARGKVAGRPRSAVDTIVAAIATVHDCCVVTGNERHYEGIETLNLL